MSKLSVYIFCVVQKGGKTDNKTNSGRKTLMLNALVSSLFNEGGAF